jgi:diaminopimelate decarboxylase
MFELRNGSLHAESVPPEAIARDFGTPCCVYSRAALSAALAQFQSAWRGERCMRTAWWVRSAKAPISSARSARWQVREGELLAAMSAGAYAMCMSSNYDSRPRAAEVMVDGTRTHFIRERERPEALFALEHLLR